MCKFCERRQDIKCGWNQPPIEDLHGNIVEELSFKAVIHDYQTVQPELILTSNRFFPDLIGTDGVATIYIPISFCPNCGRKLGKQIESS